MLRKTNNTHQVSTELDILYYYKSLNINLSVHSQGANSGFYGQSVTSWQHKPIGPPA